MNRWVLTDQITEKYIGSVQDFINKLENANREDSNELLVQDFSETELNPYTLCELLQIWGYERDNQEDNGWELDFWITMVKEGYRPISVEGCGMTFELKLSEIEE